MTGRNGAGSTSMPGDELIPEPQVSNDRAVALAARPDDDTGTELATRARIRTDGPIGRAISVTLGFGDGIMVRRQLRGLARRCGAATSA